jgi:Relaxase/Mobilisation nuclease domain
MIQKLSDPGSGFRGALDYALAAKKEPELIGGNMAGESARELAKEFGQGRVLNPAVKKPVFHGSLTAPESDRLSEEQWRRFAERYVERLGYGRSQWVLIRHHDTTKDHVHIIANRVDQDGRRVPDFQEKKRGEAIVRDLEREFGLTQVAPSREARRRAPSRGELAGFERTGEVAVKARLQEHVDLAARDSPSLPEFAERLSLQGVGVRAHVAAPDRLLGLSFELEGVRCKGSDLGRGYSWRGLAARTGLHYEAGRDLPALRALGAVAERSEPSTPGARAVGQAADRAVPAGRAAGGDPLEELRQRLREAIDRSARGGSALPGFAAQLREMGVQLRANLASTGRLSGLSFELDGVRVKGSELGRDYAWLALAGRHGLTFDAARDRQGLERLGAVPSGRAAAELPPAAPPDVATYRAAAVLSSRLEVGSRVEVLAAQGRQQASLGHEARRLLDDRAYMERQAAVQPAALEWGLRSAYTSPAAAGKALRELVAREGAGRAAEVVRQSPEQLGRLRGLGLGNLHSGGRKDALAATAGIAGELRRAAGWQRQLAATGPATAAAVSRAAAASGQRERIAAALGRLPAARSLEADMLRAVKVLGERLTARLAPPVVAAKLIRQALRAARDLLLGRDDGMSLGR